MLSEVSRARLLPRRRVAALTRRAAARVELASLLGSLSMANRTMKRRSEGHASAASEVVRCVSESSNLQDCEMTFVCAGLRSSTLNGGKRALPFCRPHFRGQQIVLGGRGQIALLACQSTGDNNTVRKAGCRKSQAAATKPLCDPICLQPGTLDRHDASRALRRLTARAFARRASRRLSTHLRHLQPDGVMTFLK
ncbi:MAG: hypothetical protein QOI12_2937 [Alphaproteobacteria bacterium]|nr:hypothetical protein [Alphaproteobacteria bacterium]